jgi:signal transduction histidine kinase
VVGGWAWQTGSMQHNRWLPVLGLAVVGLVVLANAAGEVGFGTSGAPLLVLTATGVYVAAATTLLLWRNVSSALHITLLLAMGGAASAVHAGDPDGPVVGLFLVMAFAPLRLPVRTAAAVAITSALAFNLQQASTAPNPAVFITVTNGGAAFFFAMGWLLRREQEQRAELEATRDAERVAATLAERARLAREIHDVLAHTLSGLALQLEGTRLLARSRGSDQQVISALAQAHGLARAGLADASRAVGALRGDAVPGPEQLSALVDEHRRLVGGTCQLDVDGDPVGLTPDARLTLFRTAQEALSNTRKHSTARDASVHLTWTSEGAHLIVADHGTAPPPDPSPAVGGYGLTGLAERAGLLGGEFTAGPTDDGFRVELALPAQP